MDHNNSELLTYPGDEPGLHTDSKVPEFFPAETNQGKCSTSAVTEDLSIDGSWSQPSLSRLLRSTLNPSLKWLFNVGSLAEEQEEQEENFVLANNLVSRSSARLMRLQHALLSVAPQWQHVGGVQTGAAQVCVKSVSGDPVLLLPCASSLLMNFSAVMRLQEERSLLLFLHEYSRRAHLASVYLCRLTQLLERERLRQDSSSSSWFRLVPVVQELKVHVSHWSCLQSKVQADPVLRAALVHQARLLLLQEVRQSLDLLALRALVLMERCMFLVLRAVVRTDLNRLPQEVLEDMLTGTELYNQAVEEQGVQHSAAQRRTVVLQRSQNPALGPGLPPGRLHQPAGISLTSLMILLAQHHAQSGPPTWTSKLETHTRTSESGPHIRTSNSGPYTRTSESGPHTRTSESGPHTWNSESGPHTCLVHRNNSGTRTLGPMWTWEQLQHQYLKASITHQPPFMTSDPPHPSHQTLPGPLLDPHNHGPHQGRTILSRIPKYYGPAQTRPAQTEPASLVSVTPAGLSMKLLVQLLVSSGKLVAPLTLKLSPQKNPDFKPLETDPNQELNQDPNQEPDNDLSQYPNQGLDKNLDQYPNQNLSQDQQVEGPGPQDTDRQVSSACPEGSSPPSPSPSVRWLDLGSSGQVAAMFTQYCPLLVALSSRALWLQLLAPPTGNHSINLQDTPSRFSLLQRMRRAAHAGLLPQESREVLHELQLLLLACSANEEWDYEVCVALGSALTDSCVKGVNHGGVMMSQTMEHFLCLPPPLVSSLSCCQSPKRNSGDLTSVLKPLSSFLPLHTHTVSLALATVQLSSVWVTSKSLQFLSSWKLHKFLLITLGDLKVLTDSLQQLLHQTVMLTSDLQQNLLRRKVAHLERAVSKLQVFSADVLQMFSDDCKRRSGEIFKQNMPGAAHWRPRLRTRFSGSPSEYVSLSAQVVIGQVLEGVALLSQDARVQTLSVAMTAFMEAWMEHILKHKIKFSVQGALQLKQDFDSIRGMIQSERYGLSADLLHSLLSLRVFQQVDSAVLCLLQQPQAKSYLQTRSWEPFTHCCPAHSSRSSVDSVVGNSITNLRCVEGEELTNTDPSLVNSDLPPVNLSMPREFYLAPSTALGPAQQDWLDLRIQSTVRRWRLPGLKCLSESEP